LTERGNPLGNPKLFNVAVFQCKLLKRMVGERGFESPTPWSRTIFRHLLKSVEIA